MQYRATVCTGIPPTRAHWEHGLLRFAESDIDHQSLIGTPVRLNHTTTTVDARVRDSYVRYGRWYVTIDVDPAAAPLLTAMPYCAYGVAVAPAGESQFTFTDWHLTLARASHETTASPFTRVTATRVPAR